MKPLYYLLGIIFLVATFFALATKPSYAQSCPSDCDAGCGVGFVCDYCQRDGDRGPATWNCSRRGCCNRPERCPGESGVCLEAGYHVNNRINCASDPDLCGPTPTRRPRPPTPTSTPAPLPTTGPARPRPDPYVPCSQFREPEFHSLRPYQASPCNQNVDQDALFCGNDLVLVDEFTIVKTFFAPPFYTQWTYSLDGQPIEPVPAENPLEELPCLVCRAGTCVPRIPGPMPGCDPGLNMCSGLGSECVGNCIDNGYGTETCFFNITRVRNIAIDLEGARLPIMGYTEPSLNNEDDPYRVINSVLQNETVEDALKVNEYVSWYLNGVIGRAEYNPPNLDTEEGRRKMTDYSGPLKKLLSFESQLTDRLFEVTRAGVDRHNQIVGCSVAGIPTACYPGGAPRFRLNQAFGRLLQYIPFSSTEDRVGEVEITDYSIQPVLFTGFRILSSSITNQQPAELFFAHMQESYELADLLQKPFSYQGANLDAEAEDSVVPYSPFCDLTTIRSNPGDHLFPGELSATVEYTAQVECTFCIPDPDIPGSLCRCLSGSTADCQPDADYCATDYGPVDCGEGITCGADCGSFPTGQPCDLYLAGATCVPQSWSCVGDFGVGPPPCPAGFRCGTNCSAPLPEQIDLTQECPNTVYVSFRTVTKTPLATEIWTRLVAGPSSVFRRIFPQIEDAPGRPIRRLWDIPAATSVIYEVLTPGVRVVAGNPGSGRDNVGELYFPHIGGIHEYFLKCIQKTLRPQGFGEGCATGPLPPQIANTGSGGNTGICGTYDAGSYVPPAPTRGSACEPGVAGWCSISTLTREINVERGLNWSSSQIRLAAIICNGESGGWTNALNDGCLCNRTCDFSIGLFQINALPGRCDGYLDPDAFIARPVNQCPNPGNWSCNSATRTYCCIPKSDAAAQECIDHWTDPDTNINKMITLSQNGTVWDPWAYYGVCF